MFFILRKMLLSLKQFDSRRNTPMKMSLLFTSLLVISIQSISASEYSYKAIAKRHPNAQMSAEEYLKARMEGECLVGLKELNFKKQEKFDAVAEWTNYRSISLLEQFPPCKVLIILEVAKSKLDKNGTTK